MILKRKKIIIPVLISVILVFFLNCDKCFSREQKEEEEKQFTGAEEIAPEELNILKDRSYDESIIIKAIDIKGNTLITKEKILTQLNIQPGVKFNRELIQQNLKNIYKMGYFTEKIKAVPEPGPSGITLYIEVEENIPVTGFNIIGNDIVLTEEIVFLLDNQSGLPQNITELNRSIQEIENLYADQGYILARVRRISDDPDGIINVEINEGIIDEIALDGNFKTKDFVITRNITIKPGDVYNENILKKNLIRIFGTQAFSDVRRVLTASKNVSEKYKLTIEVDEKRTGSISLGGGVDTETGFFGQTGYLNNNFLGRGQEISANFLMGSGVVFDDEDVVDTTPFQFEIKFIEPRLMQTMNSLEVNTFIRDLASYQVPLSVEKRIGASIEMARPLKKIPNLAGNISIGVENIELEEGNIIKTKELFNGRNINISKRAKQLEGGTFISLGPSLVYDTRNSLFNTTDGWYAYGNFRESFAVLGSDAETFGKVTASIRKFFPVGKKSTFTVGGKMGSKLIGKLPEFETFRLGGPYSIRGFREGDVGNGEGFMMVSAELRVPVPFIDRFLKYKILKDIRLAFFIDSGKLFDETLTNTLYNYPGYAFSVGSGLIVPLPYLGPIRFDYGYPLTSVGTGNAKGRFTFGVGDRF